MHYLVDSGHLHAVIIGNWKKISVMIRGGAACAVAAIWTLAGKFLLAVYGQGEACLPTNIILKIGQFLLQNW
jgi:hypothetical protein